MDKYFGMYLIELWTDNDHLEVCLTSLGHIVHVGLVDNLAEMNLVQLFYLGSSPQGALA